MTHTAQAAISAPEAERKGGNKRAQTSAELAALELPQHGQTAKALRGNGGPPLRCVICTGVKFAARAPKGDEQPLIVFSTCSSKTLYRTDLREEWVPACAYYLRFGGGRCGRFHTTRLGTLHTSFSFSF